MLLFLFFLHLIKYSQRNVNMFHYDYIFFLFPFISSDFCFMYLCFFVVKVSNGLWCLSSLWIVPFYCFFTWMGLSDLPAFSGWCMATPQAHFRRCRQVPATLLGRGPDVRSAHRGPCLWQPVRYWATAQGLQLSKSSQGSHESCLKSTLFV